MRMWNVDPITMCNKHLLGEHFEMHMFIGCLKKGKNIDGYIKKGLVEVHNIISRHNYIVKAMVERDMKHNSPIPNSYKKYLFKAGKISLAKNMKDLHARCPACKEIF